MLESGRNQFLSFENTDYLKEDRLNLVGDFGGGAMMLAFGIVCGLLDALKSGKGQDRRLHGGWQCRVNDDIFHPGRLSIWEAPDHPHNQARGTYTEVEGVLQPSGQFLKTINFTGTLVRPDSYSEESGRS